VTEALRRLLARRAQPLPRPVERMLLLGAAGFVIGLTIFAWRSSDLEPGDLRWWAVLTSLLIAAPVSLALRALEFDAAARLLGQSPTLDRSFRVAVVASAANLLPLPGSLIVNVRSLSEDGSTYSRALAASAVPGLSWLGLVGLVGGTGIVVNDAAAVGAIVICGGGLALVVAARLFLATGPDDGARVRLAVRIALVELGWLAISATRLLLALVALGESASISQAVALSVAGALTVAIGFFPAGLGVREILVAAIAPIVGIPFDTGVLVGVLDRAVWLTFLAIAAGVATWRSPTA
jgi:uncharacterized membrane protein YbhN (UPF0104 family)